MIHNLAVVCMLDCSESSAYFTPCVLHPRPFRPLLWGPPRSSFSRSRLISQSARTAATHAQAEDVVLESISLEAGQLLLIERAVHRVE